MYVTWYSCPRVWNAQALVGIPAFLIALECHFQATLVVKCYTETFYFKNLNCFLLYCTINLNLNQGRAMQCDVRHALL